MQAVLEEIKEDKKKDRDTSFPKWYKTFIEFNGGFKLEDPALFSRKVSHSKKAIRKVLGGTRNVQKIEIDERVTSIDYYTAKYYIDMIKQYLPEYYKTYDLKDKDLLRPTLDKFNGIKTTKHILTYARKTAVRDGYTLRQIQYSVEYLGTMYNAAKTDAGTWWVNISTAPQAFALLGHYGPDNGSCFGQTGVNRNHKYHLALSKNTFVVVISTAEQETERASRKTTCSRAWGFYNEKDKVFNVCNVYPMQNSKLISIANTEEVIRNAISNIVKTEVVKTDREISVKNGGIYLNTTPQWSFFKKTEKTPTRQVLVPVIAKGE